MYGRNNSCMEWQPSESMSTQCNCCDVASLIFGLSTKCLTKKLHSDFHRYMQIAFGISLMWCKFSLLYVHNVILN